MAIDKNVAAKRGEDSELLYHFRTHIWRQIAQFTGSQNVSSDTSLHGTRAGMYVQQAVVFPPISPRHRRTSDPARVLRLRTLLEGSKLMQDVSCFTQ
jgi:hypothetical protein